jgi:hypothetical protein
MRDDLGAQAQVARPVGAQALAGGCVAPAFDVVSRTARADYVCRRHDRRHGTSSSLSAMVRQHIASVVAAPSVPP